MADPELRNMPHADPPMDTPRPSSKTTLGISHVLTSVFKDLYAKDILRGTSSNRLKTESEGSSRHNRYVEELQKIRSDYNKSIKEADMLENHIIQAKIRAEAAEKEAYERMKENGGTARDDQGQFAFLVKSAFSWCVDSSLLRENNLIAPADYLPPEAPHVEPPAAVRRDPAGHTIACSMHLPQDDANMPIQGLVSDFSLTLDFSSDAEKRKKSPKKIKQPKPRALKDEQSTQDRMEDQEKLQMLKDRQNFLRNPRFLPLNAQQGVTSLIQPRSRAARPVNATGESSSEPPAPVFLAEPATVVFTDYTVGRVYEATLELKNVTSVSQHARVIPPSTSFFSVSLGRFPGDGGMVAPGMSCKYTIRFAPDSLGDYEDSVTVEMPMENLLVVPILAKRPPPVLTIPKVLDCGYCLIGGVKFVEFQCKNVSVSAGSFCIIPKKQWPVSNLRTVARAHYSEQAPFAVGPSLFHLQSGESVVIEVVFFPTAAERSSQDFTLVCDNCQVKEITVQGEGQLIAVEFVPASEKPELPLSEERRDATAEHLVRFGPCNPHSVLQEKVIIRNNTHVELPFHWRIVKPNLHLLLPAQSAEPSQKQFHPATDDAFQVRPPAGVLAPCQDEEFLLTFCPKELRDHHSVCHLVVNDVPHPPPQPPDHSSSSLQPLQAGGKLTDVVALEIEVKGSAEPYQVLLEPCAIVITGEIFISRATHKRFLMWNHSRTRISFQWERTCSSSHVIEIEPPAGRIERNECLEFDLIVTGLKPVRVETSALCHIMHLPQPVSLAVVVTFKGPTVTPSVPSVDFGLMELGGRAQTSLSFINITHLKANWALKEPKDHKDQQILVKPSRGMLPPLATQRVNVVFSPRFCQKYDTELQFEVVNGSEFCLSVRAVVQSPLVSLLNPQLLFSELYRGVPARATVTLLNKTLLPSHFSWRNQLQGKDAKLCTATFDPSSGALGPGCRRDVIVNFMSHTDVELPEVTALCDVQGMNSPLVLHLEAPKPEELSVAYSLPGISAAPEGVSLDFGDNVKLTSAVTKQFLMTNLTAIPTPFTIVAQYFSCSASKSKEQLGERFFQTPLGSVQAKKIEERAHSEFVSNLLANGKGAAFFVSPHTGMLGPFEAKPVDVTAYTDMWGEYRDFLICKVGRLQDTLIPVQLTVRGCPIYLQMTGPRHHDHNRSPTIRFGTHVCGGDTVSRPLHINNPTMFDIRVVWETYNVDPNARRRVEEPVGQGDAPPSPEDAEGSQPGNIHEAPERKGSSRSDGTGAPTPNVAGEGGGEEKERVAAGAERQSRTVSAAVNTKASTEDGEGVENTFPAEEKFSPIQARPHVGTVSDYPYCITPQQTVVPARGSTTVHASFTPLTLSESARQTRCSGVALGFLSLHSELAVCVPGKVVRAQGVGVEPLRVDLLAVVKPPVLSVLMEDDEKVLEFRASAGDLLRGISESEMQLRDFEVKQSLQLTNNVGTTLHFRLAALPPFSVLSHRHPVQTSNSSSLSTGGEQYLELQPTHNMQVKVVFRCSPSLLDHADQAEEDLPAEVSLIQLPNGQKKLTFQQNLLIHYSNNSQQSVPLCAHLVLPTISLSTDSVHFGLCYVGQTLTRGVRLRSHGGPTSWKSTIESDDSGVFGVAPGFGFLQTKEASTVQISFTPSEEREFRAALVILSALAKTTFTLQLQGTGSFREVHRRDDLT